MPMGARTFLTIFLLLSINVIQPKKYLVEVGEDQIEDRHEIENISDDEVDDVVEEEEEDDSVTTAKPVKSKIIFLF